MIDSVQRPRALDVDALPVMNTLTRSALPIIAAALLAGGLSYVVTAGQPKVYQASSTLFSAAGTGNQTEGLFTPPALPRGTLGQALTSPAVVLDVVNRVKSSGLPQGEINTIVSSLKSELTGGRVRSLQLVTADESNSGGVYTINGRAGSPAAARVLTNAGVNALVAWDLKRARNRMERVRNSLQGQLRALNTETPDDNINAAAYEANRERILGELALVAPGAASANGTLDIVSLAIDPAGSVAPRPLRSAALSALLTLLTAIALTLLLANMRPAAAGRDPSLGR